MGMIRSMVANGFGYALANMRPLSIAAADGARVRTIAVGGGHRPLMLGLASAQNRAPTRILDAFAEHCRTEITETRIPGMMPLG